MHADSREFEDSVAILQSHLFVCVTEPLSLYCIHTQISTIRTVKSCQHELHCRHIVAPNAFVCIVYMYITLDPYIKNMLIK